MLPLLCDTMIKYNFRSNLLWFLLYFWYIKMGASTSYAQCLIFFFPLKCWPKIRISATLERRLRELFICQIIVKISGNIIKTSALDQSQIVKMAGPPIGPNFLKEGVRGNRGMEKVLNVARVSKGDTDVSKAENRKGDGGSCLRVVSSLESLADPAWICARDSLLYAKEDKTSPGGTSGFESCWEKGMGAVSSDYPLMGLLRPGQGEEGCPAFCSFALVEVETRCPEEFDPEAPRIHAKGSRFETVSSNDFSPSIFFVFGRPLLSGGSSGLGESHEHVDLGEMEPLRVVSADGREWGKALAVVPMEGGQTTVGLGSLSDEPTVVNSEVKGYDTWEDSCLFKFSEFLGVTTAGFEQEILELMRKMDIRQHGDNRKGDPA